MEISKIMSLKKGEDSFSISGVFTDGKLNPNLTVNYFNKANEKQEKLTIGGKSSEEIVELFKKLTDFMYWDIMQFEADKYKLTDLLSILCHNENSKRKVISAENIIIDKVDRLRLRKQFSYMHQVQNRGGNYKPKF